MSKSAPRACRADFKFSPPYEVLKRSNRPNRRAAHRRANVISIGTTNLAGVAPDAFRLGSQKSVTVMIVPASTAVVAAGISK